LRQVGADLAVGVYANTFPPMKEDTESNIGAATLRPELDPPTYLDFARVWVANGATIIGGCCGIGPRHIAALKQAFG
jgi:S-methylmethionine-dependent homocysteine/selenocysteine methylase